MAIIEIPKRETAPVMPRKTRASFFSFSKTLSAISSLSIPSLPYTPSHTFSETMMEENIENAESMITKWDPSDSSEVNFVSLFKENRKEGKEFIKCVKDLRRAMHFLVSEHSSSEKLVVAHKLMQTAMKRMEEDFYHILSENREQLDPESVSSWSSRVSQSSNSDVDEDVESDHEIWAVGKSISEVERLSMIALSDLKLIADCMISSGYGRECGKIYRLIRRSIVDEGLYSLGIEQYSSSQINRMNSEAFEHHIKNWQNAIQFAIKTLFQGEKFLCDHVFSASETIRESCFTYISKEGATNLFRFPELVAKSKRSPDRIFRLMDLYESISDLWPEIESIFSYESISAIKLQALSSLHKLGDTVQTIISEFETSIQKNSSRTPVPGGGIHPLTNSVMNYMSFLANYSRVLSEVATNLASPAKLPFPESYFDNPNNEDNPTSAVSVRLAWIILVLLCKLDNKAESYNDIALSYLFLANNLQFVVEKVRSTNLKFLLGEDWILKHERKVKLYAANYETNAWSTVFSSLPENLTAVSSPEMVKGCFRQFNSTFEEAYRKQTSWVVTDGKLRDEIKVSIARKLVPAYRVFYETHLATLSEEKNLEVLVRYSPDNLGNYLSDLFHETAASGSSSSSLSSSMSRASRCLP
ncbi:unnamed protein product [Ilex paraguariensis]|uniref:Exocyst subunit Exo70 family protein n=1 Tax=Ilex paraguariensis TaxID=185542 RepID=A0ABC8U450_9AQUA